MRFLSLSALIILTSLGIFGCGSSGTTAGDSSGLLTVNGTTSVSAKGTGTITADFTSSTLQQTGATVTVAVDNPVIVFDTKSATLGSGGKATFTFRALDVQEDAVAHVTVATGSISVIRTIAVKGTGVIPGGVVVTPGTVVSLVNSIEFSSAAPKSISLKGMGGAGRSETSIVSFVVKDQFGNPLANKTVDFTLDTTVGGISLSILSAVSNASGVVQTVVSAGSTATTVLVTATVRGTSISVKSESLVISTGIPHQDGMSISVPITSTFFPEGLDFDNIVVPVQVMLADHFGNPVPDGTAVYFSSYGGSIEPAGFTTNGIASVKWRSQNPRPADGKARLLIYALGEESFIDANGSGLAELGEFTDTGEAFLDLNGNGTREANEPFIDFNGDGLFNTGDGKFNGIMQGFGNPASKHIFVNKVITMSGSTAVFSEPNPAVIALATSDQFPKITDVTIVVKDRNGNPMPEGTIVSVNTILSNCISVATGTFNASDFKKFTVSPGKTDFTTPIRNSCTAAGSTSFFVSTVTPNDQKTEKTLTISY